MELQVQHASARPGKRAHVKEKIRIPGKSFIILLLKVHEMLSDSQAAYKIRRPLDVAA